MIWGCMTNQRRWQIRAIFCRLERCPKAFGSHKIWLVVQGQPGDSGESKWVACSKSEGCIAAYSWLITEPRHPFNTDSCKPNLRFLERWLVSDIVRFWCSKFSWTTGGWWSKSRETKPLIPSGHFSDSYIKIQRLEKLCDLVHHSFFLLLLTFIIILGLYEELLRIYRLSSIVVFVDYLV